MNEIINIKDNWLTSNKSILENLGFEEGDGYWYRTQVVKVSEQNIIYNNQHVSQPITAEAEYRVYIIGDGWLADEDESNKHEFTQVYFEVFMNGKSQGGYEECIYWDGTDRIKNIINQIFRL